MRPACQGGDDGDGRDYNHNIVIKPQAFSAINDLTVLVVVVDVVVVVEVVVTTRAPLG